MATIVSEVDLPQINSLEEMIQQLYQEFKKGPAHVKQERIEAVLTAYKSNPKDWEKYAFWDANKYTRNLIDRGNGHFDVLALCWSEGQGSPIHDHSNSHCFVKILSGKLKETLFEWPNESEETEVKKIKEMTYKKDGVTYINDDIGLHRMENPSHSEGCVSLHVYTPPFSTCYKFDDWTGHKTQVPVVMTSEYGKKVEINPTCCGGSPCSQAK